MKAIFDALNEADLKVFPRKNSNEVTVIVTDPSTGKRYFANRVENAGKLNADGTPTYAWARGPEVSAQ